MRTPGAGELRESVYFERRAVSDDGFGNTVSGDFARWYPTPSGGVPAKIVPLRGGETVQAQRLAGTAIYEIWVRADSTLDGLTAADRVVDARSGEIYNIRVDVNPDMRGRFRVLTCERGVAS